jgi:hypothetical protein
MQAILWCSLVSLFLRGVAKANLKKLQDGGHNLEFHLEISINPRVEKELWSARIFSSGLVTCWIIYKELEQSFGLVFDSSYY